LNKALQELYYDENKQTITPENMQLISNLISDLSKPPKTRKVKDIFSGWNKLNIDAALKVLNDNFNTLFVQVEMTEKSGNPKNKEEIKKAKQEKLNEMKKNFDEAKQSEMGLTNSEILSPKDNEILFPKSKQEFEQMLKSNSDLSEIAIQKNRVMLAIFVIGMQWEKWEDAHVS
jgi:hypothetical protein